MALKKVSSGHFFFTALMCMVLAACAYGAGIVPSGTTQLADSGSSSSPAMWWLDDDYISPSGSTFIVGGSWNYLTINNGYTFAASSGLTVGTTGGAYNLLDVQADSSVVVNGDFYCGQTTSISYYGRFNKTVVSGIGAQLEVTGNLQIGSGGAWLVTDNTLNISNGGVVIVDSDKNGTGNFGAANHWAYGNSWLELDGGLLTMWGDKTANFAYGAGILSSIKVWDDASSSFQRVAYYQSNSWYATEFLDLLSVEYISDSAKAASLGLSGEFVGFTVVQAVPEPTTLVIMTLCSAAILRRRRDA